MALHNERSSKSVFSTGDDISEGYRLRAVITITVDGRPVATLEPGRGRPRSMGRDRFVHEVLARRADPGLLADIRTLAPDTTDDLPVP